MLSTRTWGVPSLALALAILTGGEDAGARAAVAESVPGELIVRFEPGTAARERLAARDTADVDFDRALPLRRTQLVSTERGQSVATAAAQLERSPDVAYAEPNYVRESSALPDDPFFSKLYGLDNTGQTVAGIPGTPDADIDAPEAWELAGGSPDAVAAVIDSGVDLGHPDLAGAIWTNPGETGAGRESNGVDDDANGLVDDWRGWDWASDDGLPADENGHGTHVSGTIAATADNATGITGVSSGSRVMALRVLDAAGSGSVADLISAYRYAGAEGARVVNASLGGSGFSRSELAAIEANPDTLFVVAAGNGGVDGVGDDVESTPEYPCAYPAANIVCVAATDQDDAMAGFSNFGSTSVDLAAPGVRTLSTVPGGGYAYYSGTSMATPHVAGTAALIASRFPTAGVAAMRAALFGGTDPKPALAAATVTGGRLNAEGALRSAARSAGVELPGDSPGIEPPGDSGSPEVEPPGGPLPAPAAAPPVITPVEPAVASAPPPAADRSAPRISLSLVRGRGLGALLSRGLVLRSRCSERCKLALRVRVDPRTAIRSRLSRTRRTKVVGRAARGSARRSHRVVIRLSRRARVRLRRLRVVRLTVTATATDAAGNARRVRRDLRVRR
ncbi:MAG: S8 family peptidase [Egibacteraceae bacterium]